MQKLLKISLTTTLIGILILLILINFKPIKIIPIQTISELNTNEQIAIQGTLDSIRTYKTMQILNIKDNSNQTTNTIQVITYNLNLSKSQLHNQQLTIIGKPSEYNGQPQIIADKIIIKTMQI
jgi:RecG-like helicase